MTQSDEKNDLKRTKREMELAAEALSTAGAGAIGNLECRMADLQVRFLTTPGRSLDDVLVRVEVIRTLVASLGEPGYLLHLVDATLDDLRRMTATDAGK